MLIILFNVRKFRETSAIADESHVIELSSVRMGGRDVFIPRRNYERDSRM